MTWVITIYTPSQKSYYLLKVKMSHNWLFFAITAFPVLSVILPAGFEETILFKHSLSASQRLSCDVSLFVFSNGPTVIQWVWGLITVEVKPFRSALLALLWTSNRSGMALMYVEGHCPVGDDILFPSYLRRLACACFQLQNLWDISTL